MAKYMFKITEELSKIVIADGEDYDEAIMKVENAYDIGGISIEYADIDVEFNSYLESYNLYHSDGEVPEDVDVSDYEQIGD